MPLFLAVRTARPKPTRAPGPIPNKVHCPSCGKAEGFVLDLDGVAHRVLEDDLDTDLLHEAAATELPTPVTCLGCKRVYTAEETLRFAASEAAETDLFDGVVVARPKKGAGPSAFREHGARIHKVGKAAVRHTLDGRRLPVCPQCGAMHGFFADIGGAAYRVLEDDADTDLLAEASNLLCPRCSAVFEFEA